jgi:hypothetical protein
MGSVGECSKNNNDRKRSGYIDAVVLHEWNFDYRFKGKKYQFVETLGFYRAFKTDGRLI